MSKKQGKLSFILVALGLIFIATIGIRTISNPDLWTHLAQANAEVPLSFLEAETSVNTTHLYDKFASILWEAGGASLLILVNTSCVIAAFGLLLLVAKKWGGAISQALALLIAGQLIFPAMDVGPESVMMLFTALFIYILSTAKKPAVLWAVLLPVQLLWTNMHGSFILGPAIALLAALQAFQQAKFTSRKTVNQMQPGGIFALTAGLLAVTFINPHAGHLHAQAIASIMNPNPIYWSTLMHDFFSTSIRDPLIFFVLVLGAGGLITLKKRLPFMLTTLAIIGAFIVVFSSYTVQLFTVLALPFMVLSFTAVGEYIIGSMGPILKEKTGLLHAGTTAIFCIIFLMGMASVISNSVYRNSGSASSFGLGVNENLFTAGTETLIEHPDFPKTALNLPADGGYLAFKHPDRKIFLDYRSGKYPKDLLKDFNKMLFGDKEAYDRIMLAHKPGAIIINLQTSSAAAGLANLLRSKTWKLAYLDGSTAVLLSDIPKHQSILTDTSIQQGGLAKLAAAKESYAAAVKQGRRGGNATEIIGAARAFLALNRPAPAKELFELLVKDNPKVPGAWIGLGNSQIMLRELDDAVVSLEQATEVANNSALAWVSLGNAYRMSNNPEGLQRVTKKLKRFKQKKSNRPEEKPADPVTENTLEDSRDVSKLTIPENL